MELDYLEWHLVMNFLTDLKDLCAFGSTCKLLREVMYRHQIVTPIRAEDGTLTWRHAKAKHRSFDEPAVIHPNGDKEWWFRGVRHREKDMPAVVRLNGNKEWWLKGKRYREGDKPVYETGDGHFESWADGRFHIRDVDLKPGEIRCEQWGKDPDIYKSDGTIEEYNNGDDFWPCRADDLPARVYEDGLQEWFQGEEAHREGDKPAKIYPDGTMAWMQHHEFHRDGDLPAIIAPSGHMDFRDDAASQDEDYDAEALERGPGNSYKYGGVLEWFKHNLYHRDGGKPARICADGTMEWYQRGHLHRDNDLPAIIRSDGTREWYCRGKRDRVWPRPAVMHADGSCEMWQNGNRFLPESEGFGRTCADNPPPSKRPRT
jgi:predicted lipoprotein with Yx(FWY)xxD motif